MPAFRPRRLAPGEGPLYRQAASQLELWQDVTLYRDDGTTLTTAAVSIDLKNGAAASGDPTHVEGPFGVLDAQGFTVIDKGEAVHFTGPARAITEALADAGLPPSAIGYVNAHATSTPVGDITELDAIRKAFGDKLTPQKMPLVSSTKSLTGHSQGATGAHEAIYSLLMLKNDFVAASANIENLDPAAGDYPIARQRIDNAGLQTVMSNSFGFGGTNACLLFTRYDH